MPTIKQIAELAGVSRGTVDRVLNNRSNVNSDTEDRVRKIAESLNYSPNKAGRSLAIKKKNLRFAFILFNSNKSNPFFDDVSAAIEKKAYELEEYGVSVDILYSDFGSVEHQLVLLDRLASEGVSGIAITPINNPAIAEKINELYDMGIPTVTVNTDIENSRRIAYVGSDYLKSGRTAGNLMELVAGKKAHIGIVTGSNEVLCHSRRVDGFITYLNANCPDMDIGQIVENHDDDIESYKVTRRLLESDANIDALFLTAAGVYGACRAVIELDRHPTIICYDCVPTTRALLKKGVITATIDQQPRYQGKKPLDILFDYLTLGDLPTKEKCFTNLEILIKENLSVE